ncbi:MAG: hypothetical protein ACYDAQ_14885 [Mycobacteriales bacterium]
MTTGTAGGAAAVVDGPYVPRVPLRPNSAQFLVSATQPFQPVAIPLDFEDPLNARAVFLRGRSS